MLTMIYDEKHNINHNFSPASTISTLLVMTNLVLAFINLGGLSGANGWLVLIVPVIGLLRLLILLRLLANAGHAANDLFLIYKRPQSVLGKIKWFLTWLLTLHFSCCCSYIQTLWLQSSKVSDN